MTETVAENTVASVHYTGTLPDSGEVFDSSEGRDPLTFLVGHRQMIPGFESNLLGAKVGERREFTLEPADAYGERDDEAVLGNPENNLLNSNRRRSLIGSGHAIVAQMPHGPCPIFGSRVTEETVKADFNHALAGKSLTFSVEVVELRAASDEEIAHGHVHGPGGYDH